LKSTLKIILSILFSFSCSLASACPFCGENLSKNNGGFTGGISMGILITIFLFLGVLGSLVGFIVYSIREGDKRAVRRQLARETLPQA
jgi:hypothetical protein